jgi:hypothetical protein
VACAGSAAAEPNATYRASSITLDGLPAHGVVARAAVTWCGVGQPIAVDRKPELDLSSPRQVHVTYAVPADGLDQFGTFASRIATDAEAMDTWWRGQDGARALRFDLYAFPGCAAKFGGLDIGFVRLPRVSALYTNNPDRLIGDLSQLTSLTSQKHLIYYDGPNIYENFVCGTTFVPNSAPTQGGAAGIAFVWTRSLCGGDIGAGGLNAAVAVHEVIHGLGALVGSPAPNECPPPNDGHVCESTVDVLYPSANSTTRLPTQVLDVNRDDYYGHSRSWFDLQDSGWLSHLPQLALTVAVQGTGPATGAVRMTSPAATTCSATCSYPLDTGVVVTFVAQPSTGSRLLAWGGACTGSGACTVTLDAAKSVTARFAAAVSRITVSVSGKGRVTSTPGGIACPARCSATYLKTQTVRLRATPAAGQQFTGWTGACKGKGTCTLNADKARSTKAVFKKKKR